MFMVIPVLTRKGALRPSMPGDFVLLRCELLLPLRVRLPHFFFFHNSLSFAFIRKLDELYRAPQQAIGSSKKQTETGHTAQTGLEESSSVHTYNVDDFSHCRDAAATVLAAV